MWSGATTTRAISRAAFVLLVSGVDLVLPLKSDTVSDANDKSNAVVPVDTAASAVTPAAINDKSTVASDGSSCFRSGDIVASVIGTFVVTVVLFVIAYFVYQWVRKQKRRQRNKSGPLTEDEVDNSSRFAYDNPYFHDDQETGRQLSLDTAEKGELGSDSLKANTSLENKNHGNALKSKKGKLAKTNLFSVLTNTKGHKYRAQDDSCITLEPEVISVPLQGIDFTGLGFNVCGNMRDGIFIKDVLHRGPAMESGRIKAGDRILSVTVSFTNMVYEDALTILSYASPYNVKLEVQKMAETGYIPGHQKKGSNASNMSGIGGGERLYHPLYRSRSIADLSKIGREDNASKRSSSVGGVNKTQSKRDVYVRTSLSLREEGAVDVVDTFNSSDQEKSPKVSVTAGSEPSPDSSDSGDGGKQAAVSRFKVQKVTEVDESKLVKNTQNLEDEIKISVAANRESLRSDKDDDPWTIRKTNHESDVSTLDQSISFTPDEVLLTLAKNEKDDEYTKMDKISLSSSSSSEKNDENYDDLSNLDYEKFELIVLDPDSQKSLQSSGSAAAAKRSGAANKRKAPPPPPLTTSVPMINGIENVVDSGDVVIATSDSHHVTTLKVSPDIHEVPSWVKETEVDNVAIQTNFSSDSDSSASDEDNESKLKKKLKGSGGQLILQEVKRPSESKQKKKDRRASSLGDLTKVEETVQKNFPLERSVSMDFNHAETLLVDGQLGVQHNQIKNRLTTVGEVSVSDEMLPPLKNHFAARENLHLDNIYKKSWENLENSGLEDKPDIVDDAVEETSNNHEEILPVKEWVAEGVRLGTSNGIENGYSKVPNVEKKEEDDGMSDVTLSDREMSDVSSSLSDDSLEHTKPQVVAVKKMIPVDASLTKPYDSDTSDSEDDEKVSSNEPTLTTNETNPVVNTNDSENLTTSFIHHDAETGSSLVTIGSPPVPHPRSKHSTPGSSNPQMSPKINPEMAKIFSNITVRNAPIDLIENKNGSEHADDSRGSHNGNGNVSPDAAELMETMLDRDIIDETTERDNKLNLISFESPTNTDETVPQKITTDKFPSYTVSEGAMSRTVIISNPQLTAHLKDSELNGPESPPPTLQPAE